MGQVIAMLKYCACVLLAAATMAAADPPMLNLAPPDAGLLMGINIEKIKSSQFGQAMASEIQAKSQELSAKVGAPGMQLLDSIQEVLIAAPLGQQKNKGLVVLRGTFDMDALTGLATTMAGPPTTVGGVKVFTKKGPGQAPSLAVVSPTMVLLGDPDSIRAAVRRLPETSVLYPRLAAKAQDLSEIYDIWIATNANLADLAGQAAKAPAGNPMQAQLLKSLRQVSGGIKFEDGLRIAFDLVAESEKDASSMADALRLVLAMAASNPDAKQVAPLLEKLRLTTDGDTMKLALAIPEADLMKAVQSAVQAQHPQVEQTKTKPYEAPVEQKPQPSDEPIVRTTPGGTTVVTLPAPEL
jgi:hypothetical protein